MVYFNDVKLQIHPCMETGFSWKTEYKHQQHLFEVKVDRKMIFFFWDFLVIYNRFYRAI